MIDLVKIFLPFFVSFGIGVFLNPILLYFLYKNRVWRKSINSKEVLLEENRNEISKIINKNTKDLKTPRMGGLVIILATLLTLFIFWSISYVVLGNVSGKFDFLSRNQTWLVLFAFILGSILGLIDDLMTIKDKKDSRGEIGLSLKFRLAYVGIVSVFFALFFYFKLGFSSINIPFLGLVDLGWFYPIFFVLVFFAVYGTSNIDGLDGLAGGVMFIIYFVFGLLGYFGDYLNLSAFLLTIAGGILAFLWYNLAPAKFYMSEIGYNALSFTLIISAFLLKSVFLLPIVGIMLLATLISTILQVFWIRIFKKRIFKVAPLHHHYEALGLSKNLIVTRYWLITFLGGILTILIYLWMNNF